MRTSNPTLTADTFVNERAIDGHAMTLQGTVNKTFILLFCLIMSASWIWGKLFGSAPMFAEEATAIQGNMMSFAIGGALLGFVFAIVTVFNKQWSPVTAPLYALCEGVFLGGISASFEMSYPGIVIQAVALTFGTLFCLLLAYKSGAIKVTENFKLGVVSATGGICLIYFVSFILGFFGIRIPFIHEGGLIGIGFSLFVVVIASLNLVLDFDFIERGVEVGTPKYMEWYAAFGLLVTLVWLYLEILRLLAKIRGRR